ncbi:MAG: 3-oxoacyl-ACP reductase [Rhodanobacter sp. SCN 68-63]|nr:MAG: 3-oxoacyl-ACP reductase [Rhodanobacter sp. SCN 68-63]
MPPRRSKKELLLIGASRGLGLALAEEYLKRDWSVVATERDARTSGLSALVQEYPGRLAIETVDIVHPSQVAALRQRLASNSFDMLFVNAGVTTPHHESAAEVSIDEFVRLMVTNALSPIRTIEALQDLVVDGGTIGVMSSGRGSVANNEDGKEDVYRGSKAALNTFMRSFAARHARESRTLLLMAPGWVRTDMGGPEARLSIEQSIPNLANTMDAQAGRPGLQYLDYLGRRVPW